VSGLRERGKARRKDRIIESAKRLLAAGGLEALSLRRLAEEAELSVRTLYSLVGSKEQVLVAVMQHNHDRVLADLLDIDEQHPVEKLIAFVESTYRIIAEDAAAQKPLMRVLMTLYYEGRLSPHPWWLLSTEKGWMDAAIAEAMQRGMLSRDVPVLLLGDLLMKVYLSNLRDYLFDRSGLDEFRDRTVFEFWYSLSNVATGRLRQGYLGKALRYAEVVAARTPVRPSLRREPAASARAVSKRAPARKSAPARRATPARKAAPARRSASTRKRAAR
jgi:AcrR family transcriptional regulator